MTAEGVMSLKIGPKQTLDKKNLQRFKGNIFYIKIDENVAVVVEWLACLPVTQKIGVRFYLERESSATSGWN